MEMSYEQIKYMTDAKDVIQAQHQLRSMDASAYPQMKDDSRKNTHREWHKKAFPSTFVKRAVRNEDLILST